MKERDLSFEINSSKDLTRMLTGALMDARRGEIDSDRVKNITLIADKINKNNANAIQYKSISKSVKPIDFFEE